MPSILAAGGRRGLGTTLRAGSAIRLRRSTADSSLLADLEGPANGRQIDAVVP